MSDIKDRVDAFAAKGVMTRAEHDALIADIQSDGVVDDAESEQLSRIFKLVADKKLLIVESEKEAKLAAKKAKVEPAKPEAAPTSSSSPQDDPYKDLRFKSRGTRPAQSSLAASAIGGGGKSSTLTREQMEKLQQATTKPKSETVPERPAKQPQLAQEEEPAARVSVPDDAAPSDQTLDADGFDETLEVETQADDQSEQDLDEEQTARVVTSGSSMTIGGLMEYAASEDESFIPFELETDRILRINLNSSTWVKTGSMIAYYGNINFVREGIVEHGLGRMVSKAVTREGTKLTKAQGKGRLYLADQGKKVTILELKQETLVVNGDDLLALQKGIKWEIKAMKQFAALMAGGLFNVHLRGMGMLAITTHYDPLVLRVTRSKPVATDPNATVAWSGSLSPKVKADMQMKTLVGRGSGETIQMVFQGEGFVVVQPYEERDRQGE
ncbi:MAG: AIM24 family protein [Bdellovibrionales bacterium]|nr:AIM24 family protein [Bdellovibrionales bacterium]